MLEEDARQTYQFIRIEEYVPQNFPKDDIDLYAWIHTLSTIDVSALIPKTKFCDEDGYKIIPTRVVSLVYPKLEDSNNPKVLSILCDAMSIVDLASSKSKCSAFKIPFTVITQQCLCMAHDLIDLGVSLNVLL